MYEAGVMGRCRLLTANVRASVVDAVAAVGRRKGLRNEFWEIEREPETAEIISLVVESDKEKEGKHEKKFAFECLLCL
jgi:hypothetical protein